MSSTSASRPLLRALPAFTATLLAGLALLAGSARADQLTTNLSGKVVSVVATGNPDAVSQLAAHGVQVGASVTGTIVIESTTPGVLVQDAPYDFMQYDMAVVDVSLGIGTWTAHFGPPAGYETLNFVQVANDVSNITSQKFDAFTVSAIGPDTDDILSAGQFTDFGTFLMIFVKVPPNASSNEGLVQDLSKYTTSRITSFAGPGGVVTIDFGTTGGGGGGSTKDPTALARQGELKAAASLGNSLLKGLGKFAGAPPEKDPLGTAKDALVLDVQKTFGEQFLAAVNKALKKGGSAPLGESGKQEATDSLMGALQPLADSLTAGEDTSDKFDRALRGALLKAAAMQAKSDFTAQSADAKKPAPDKLSAKLAKSRAKLAASVGKALDKATAKGVVYAGPDANAISDSITSLVDAFVDLTKNGVK